MVLGCVEPSEATAAAQVTAHVLFETSFETDACIRVVPAVLAAVDFDNIPYK